MLQHTQAMAPFCFRIVRAACIVDSPDGMTAVPMSSFYYGNTVFYRGTSKSGQNVGRSCAWLGRQGGLSESTNLMSCKTQSVHSPGRCATWC